ncbi:hypothetical protein LPJ61_004207 [Coemansia biformis]|uniref:Uncharacterized protein n=1 Tax=Coemansia biformis TaxID=1286918 RepID=A0A9W7Y590_9FUNG|nr:hypothetical protein LPJ61_004207 [Coemansia biformis]
MPRRPCAMLSQTSSGLEIVDETNIRVPSFYTAFDFKSAYYRNTGKAITKMTIGGDELLDVELMMGVSNQIIEITVGGNPTHVIISIK